MLIKIRIVDGYGFINRDIRHLKIVSSPEPVRVRASALDDSQILDSTMRAPMAIEFDRNAKRVEFFAQGDFVIEAWAGLMPLEYLQLTAVGGTAIKTRTHGLLAGTLQQLLEPTPRKKVLVKTTTPISIKSDPADAGWPLGENEQIELELTGALYAQKAASVFISAAASHASVDSKNLYIDANTRVVFWQRMANGDLIYQLYRETVVIERADGTALVQAWGFACADPQTGAVYVLTAALDSQSAAGVRVYRHDGTELRQMLSTAPLYKFNKDCMSYGNDNALYVGGWLGGNRVIRVDLVTADITSFATPSTVSACTRAVDNYIYYVSNNILWRRASMTADAEQVMTGINNTAGAHSGAFSTAMLLRQPGNTAKTAYLINLLTMGLTTYSEPSGGSDRYGVRYDGVNWFLGQGDGRLMRLQNGALEVVGGAVLNAGGNLGGWAGYDAQLDKIVVGVSPAASDIRAAYVDVIMLGDARPAIVSTLETFI